MKVAVLTHFYPPEACAAALRVRSMVDAFASMGHDVTVVTSHPSFQHEGSAPRPRSLPSVEHAENARIVRLFSILAPKLPGLPFAPLALSRVLRVALSADDARPLRPHRRELAADHASLSGARRSRAASCPARRRRPRRLSRHRRLDGRLEERESRRAAHGAARRRLYRRADLVVVVTAKGISQIAARGVDPDRIILARNAYERDPIVSDLPPHAGNGRGFTAVYAGNLGLATDVDVLVDAAALVAGDGITIDIIGDGAQGTRMRERVVNEDVRNLRIKGSFSRSEALAMVSEADVSVIPLRKGLTESIPTKLYDSLSLACPVVLVAEGEAIGEGSSLGAFCTPAGDANALAAILRQLSLLDKSALRKIGDDGKSRLSDRPDRAAIMSDLVGRIAALC